MPSYIDTAGHTKTLINNRFSVADTKGVFRGVNPQVFCLLVSI